MQFLLAFLLFAVSAAAAPGRSFEENRGQVNARVAYFVSTPSTSVLFTAEGVEFLARDAEGRIERLPLRFPGARRLSWQPVNSPVETIYYPPSRASAPARRYARLTAREIYPGIALDFYFQNDQLEYDFTVQPGADPTQIRLAFPEGAAVRLMSTGAFASSVARRAWHQLPPHVYQVGLTAGSAVSGRDSIAATWRALGGGVYGFQSSAYDRSRPLVIDPVVEFLLFLGEGGEEITATGNGYVAGNFAAPLLDGSAGNRPNRDVFVRTIPSSSLPAANLYYWREKTFVFGGSGDDTLAGVTVLFDQNAISIYFGGTTSSTDFDFYNKYAGGGSDAFIASYRLVQNAPSGLQNPVFNGRYFGGSGSDRAQSVSWQNTVAYVAGVTDSADLPLASPFQASPGGGVDAFVAILLLQPQDALVYASYFGGTGDDQALKANVLNDTFYVVGETRSPSIPSLPGTLAGGSDAFVLALGPFATAYPYAAVGSDTLRRALRWGGAGEDRFTAVWPTATVLSVAGESNSPDFPTRNAAQGTLAGGVDAVLVQLALPSAEVIFSTYFGGTGDETVAALEANRFGELLLAGSTTSMDLPVREAVQATNGGGRDAFYAYLNADGTPVSISYYGGAGEDAARAIYLASGGPFAIAGTSSSPDLPAPRDGSVNKGAAVPSTAVSSFLTQVSLPLLYPPDNVWVARGLRSQFVVSSSQALSGRVLTATVEDPSVAVFRVGSAALSTVTVDGNFAFTMEAVAESGQTFVTFSAPGFPARRIPLAVGRAALTLPSVPAFLPLATPQRTFSPTIAIVDPATDTLVYPNLSASFLAFLPRPIDVRWRVSDPTVLQLTPPTNAISSFGAGLTPVGAGMATVEIQSALAFWPAGGLPVTVSPLSLIGPAKPIPASPYANTVVPFSSPTASPYPFNLQNVVRVTSSDPARLLVSVSGNDFGASAASYRGFSEYGINVSLRALDSAGTVSVRLTSPAIAEDAVAVVQLQPLVLVATASGSGFASGAAISAPPNTRANLNFNWRFAGADGDTVSVLPTANLKLDITSSNPAVAVPSAAVWSPGSPLPFVNILAPGTAQIRLTSSSPHLQVDSTISITATGTAPSPFSVTPRTIGNQLVAAFQVRPAFGYSSTTPVEIVSEDPNLVALSLSPTGTPGGSLSVSASGTLSFYATGLSDSGVTRIRIRIPNYQDTVIPIRLGPSVFAFTESRRVADFTQPPTPVSVRAYVLDPVTYAPLEAQSLRPGATAELSVVSSSPSLTLDAATCAISLTAECKFTYAVAGPGDSTLTLNPPAASPLPPASAPPSSAPGNPMLNTGQQLAIRSLKSNLSLSLASAVAGALTVASTSRVTTQVDAIPFQVTITSLEPEKLLLSVSPTTAGQPSITLRVGTAYYIHGLAAPAAGEALFARVRYESPAIDSFEIDVPCYDWSLALVRSANYVGPADTILVGSKIPYTVNLVSSAGLSTLGPRPGAEPIPLTLSTAGEGKLSVAFNNPAVTAFTPGTAAISITISGETVGPATILPTGGTRAGLPSNLTVRLPRLLLRPQVIGVNGRVRTQVQLEAGAPVPTTPSTLRIRSLDPSRLRLQFADATAPGVASIELPWSSNLSATDFLIDSYEQMGEAGLEFSLPGYEPYTGTIVVASLALQMSSSVVNLGNTYPNGPTYFVDVSAAPALPAALAGDPAVRVPSVHTFRPGYDPARIPFVVEADDPSVIEVLTGTGTFPSAAANARVSVRAAGPGISFLRFQPSPNYVQAARGANLYLTVPSK